MKADTGNECIEMKSLQTSECAETVKGESQTAQRVTSGGPIDNEASDGKGNMDASRHQPRRIPNCFNDYKKRLKGFPAFVGKPKSFSHYKEPVSIVACLWLVLLLHEIIILQDFHELPSAPSQYRWLPIGPATLLTVVATQSTLYIKHRIRLASLITMVKGEQMFVDVCHTVLIFTIAPLLCLPISSFYKVAGPSSKEPGKNFYRDPYGGPRLKGDLKVPCATLSSWSDLKPNFADLKPPTYDFYSAHDISNDWLTTTKDIWVIEDNDTKSQFPDPVNFFLPRGGRGSSEEGILDNDANLGLYLPALPVEQPLFDTLQLEHRWSVFTDVLGFGLNCEYLDSNDVTLARNETTGITSVSATDTTGCFSSTILTHMTLDAAVKHKALQLLDQLEDHTFYQLGNVDFGLVQDFITDYRSLMSSENRLIAFQPAWASGSSPHSDLPQSYCRARLFLFSSSKSVVDVDSLDLLQAQVQAASCTSKYTRGNMHLMLERTSRGPFQRMDARYNLNSSSVDAVTPSSGTYKDFPVDDRLQSQLDSLFSLHSNTSQMPDMTWPLAQLREEYKDKRWNRRIPIGPLLTTGRVFCHSFVNKLSMAATLTLQEAIVSWNKSTKPIAPLYVFGVEEPIMKRIEKNTLQTMWQFQFYKYFWAIVLSIAFLVFVPPMVEETEKLYSSPWDVSTIAATAALLRNSGLKEWFLHHHPMASPIEVPVGTCVGYWVADEQTGKKRWRIDNAGVENPPPISDAEAYERSWNLASDRISAWLITSLTVGILLIMYLIITIRGLYASESPGTEEKQLQFLWVILDLRGIVDGLYEPFDMAKVLPIGFLFMAMFCYFPSFRLFYQSRQPWVSMKTPQPAHRSITVDYWNDYFTLVTAIRNRHWLVASLIFAGLLHIAIPSSVVLLFDVIPRPLLVQSSSALRRFSWREDLDAPTKYDLYSFKHSMLGLSSFLASRNYISDWSSHSGALTPVDINNSTLPSTATYATTTASLLTASLECEEVELKLAMSSHSYAKITGLIGIDHLDFVAKNSAGLPFTRRLTDPCGSPYAELDTKDSVNPSSILPFTCGRWWLHDSAPATFPDELGPVWLIAYIRGRGLRAQESGRILFLEDPLVTGITCKPKATVQEAAVIASIEYSDAKSNEAMRILPAKVDHFPPQNGQSLPHLASAISHGLNKTINASNDFNKRESGGTLELLHSKAFVGDIMSYVMYSDFFAGGYSMFGSDTFKTTSSLIFTAYTASLATTTDLLKNHTTSKRAEVNYFEVRDDPSVHWGWFWFLALNILFFFILIYLTWNLPAYFHLPFDPECLLQRLHFLAGSTLVSRLEEQMPDVEELSLGEFHKAIESWGFTYRLNHGEILGNRRTIVEVMEASNGEGYRDEPDETCQTFVSDDEQIAG